MKVVRHERSGGRERLRFMARSLPAPLKTALKSALGLIPVSLRHRLGITFQPSRAPRSVRWGNLRRSAPFDRNWGYGRGTPIDRIYIEAFLQEQAADVRGHCLEVLNSDYTRRFGGSEVVRSDILDVNPNNPAATIIADLGETDSLPAERFDCFILTQTLHLVADMTTAIRNAWLTLKPGGVLLVTVSALGRHEVRPGFEHDRWRLTPSGMRWLISRLDVAEARVRSYGNVLACVAMLHGLASEELHPSELETHDPEFPLVVAARIKRSGKHGS